MTDAAASTTQTSQQSSSQQSQQGSDQGNGGGSQTTTTSQATASRPDYVPEQFWDAGTNAVKAQEFGTHIGELAALKAREDARVAALPKDAAGYAIAPPKEFKLPDGWSVDDKHPLAEPVRNIALKHQIPQEAVSDLVQAFGEMQIAETQTYNAYVAEEEKKLGANATARVTALRTWLTGTLGQDAANDLIGTKDKAGLVVFSAAAVQYLEKLQLAMSNQGGSSYSNGGREPPPIAEKPLEQKLWPKRQGVA